MLPSNFERTANNLFENESGFYKGDMQNDGGDGPTPSSADYKIERVIGKKHIAQAQIKACPQYSFGRSQTHRTVDNVSMNSNERGSRSRSRGKGTNYISLSTVS